MLNIAKVVVVYKSTIVISNSSKEIFNSLKLEISTVQIYKSPLLLSEFFRFIELNSPSTFEFRLRESQFNSNSEHPSSTNVPNFSY